MRHILLSVTALFALSFSHAQNAGDLDLSFNTTGIFTQDFGFQDNITDVKIFPDQKIVTCGTALSPAFAGQLLVMRQNPDGTLDESFNGTGSVVINTFTESYAYESLPAGDGKILVAGAAANPNYLFSALVMRMNDDGSLDTSFGTDGVAQFNLTGTDHFAYAMRLQSDGKILLAGSAIDANFNNQPIVIRLLENGTLDESFGVNGVAAVPVTEIDNRFNSLEVQSDGKILAAGHISNPITPDGQTDFDILVARFNTDGTPDTSFGTDGILTDGVSENYIDDIFELALTDDEHIVIGGYTTLPDFSFDAIVLQYDQSGERDASFGTNGLVQFDNAVQDVALGVVVQPDGKIVAAGTSGGFFFDNRDVLVMRLNSDGTFDTGFGTDGIVLTEVNGAMDEANAVALQADGKIVIAGKANVNNLNDALTIRYLGEGDPNAVNESTQTALTIYPNPVNGQRVIAIEGMIQSSVLTLTDASGRMVSQYTVIPGQTTRTMVLPQEIASGIYMIQADGIAHRMVID
jgi:uncharacterized delta-60 repeat protein